MSNPAAAVSTSAGRYYQLDLPAAIADQASPDVRRSGNTIWLPSATNILDAAAKPGLVWWSAGLVASAVFTNPDRITSLVGAAHDARQIAGDNPCEACGELTDHLVLPQEKYFHPICHRQWKTLRKTFNDERTAKADLGTLVHDLVEKHILGDSIDPADYDPAVAGRVASWLRFVDKHHPEFVMAEATVFNLEYGYAGTLDMIVDVGGQRWLVDTKSGTPRVYESYRMQLAAYRNAERVYLGPGETVELPDVEACAVLFLGEDRFKFEPVDVTEADFSKGFLSLLQYQSWLVGL